MVKMTFQSSFSEFDLWNTTSDLDANHWRKFQSSFSEFDLWNSPFYCFTFAIIHYFNPHFLSLTFETKRRVYIKWKPPNFNPHFLSLTFETTDESTAAPVTFRYFNPHFLSLTFETVCMWNWYRNRNIFQSSFSEFDLWNTPFSWIYWI